MAIETPTTTEPLTDPNHDPLADKTSDLVGQIAVCGIGFLGRIERRAFTTYGKWAWCGTSLHGKPWSSTRPVVLDPQDQYELNKLFDLVPQTNEISAGIPEKPTGMRR